MLLGRARMQPSEIAPRSVGDAQAAVDRRAGIDRASAEVAGTDGDPSRGAVWSGCTRRASTAAAMHALASAPLSVRNRRSLCVCGELSTASRDKSRALLLAHSAGAPSQLRARPVPPAPAPSCGPSQRRVLADARASPASATPRRPRPPLAQRGDRIEISPPSPRHGNVVARLRWVEHGTRRRRRSSAGTSAPVVAGRPTRRPWRRRRSSSVDVRRAGALPHGAHEGSSRFAYGGRPRATRRAARCPAPHRSGVPPRCPPGAAVNVAPRLSNRSRPGHRGRRIRGPSENRLFSWRARQGARWGVAASSGRFEHRASTATRQPGRARAPAGCTRRLPGRATARPA